MTMQLLDSVMSPEAGVQVSAGRLPMGMGGPPPGPGGRPRGPGGPPPGMGMPPPASVSFAKRLDTLKNKMVYLVDIGFGGGYDFMLQLQKWFSKNMPSVNAIVKRKPGSVFMDDKNDLWQEIKQKGNAAVVGVAG